MALSLGVPYGGPLKLGALLRLSAAAAVFVPYGALTASRPPTVEWSPAVTPLVSPAATNSAQPQLSVQGDHVVLSWVERRGETATLRFSERTEQGWTQARTAASGTNWFVNWADVPSVVRLQGESLAAHWLQKSASSTYAYDVRLAFSTDEGKTWSNSVTPHHDGTQTEHGFASLFQMSGAGLGLVWLDGRRMKQGTHDGMDAGSMTVRSAVFNADGRQTSELLVDDRVCECCPTAAAVKRTAQSWRSVIGQATKFEISMLPDSSAVNGRSRSLSTMTTGESQHVL